MRAVSYNILDGGTGRAEALAAVIAAKKSDVVALVEAEDAAVVDAIARSLGMTAIQAIGHSHASALLTRWTIRESVNHAVLRPALEKSLLETTVVEPSGREWTFGVVHLHARAGEEDEQRREAEIAQVLDVFAPHRAASRPHLLVGDFNANAPYQQIDPEKCKPKTRAAWKRNGGGIPRRVVQRLLEAGYQDTLREYAPSAAEHVASFTTEFPGQRVDYIFAFGIAPTRIRAAWVDQSDGAKKASDHFPVGVEID